MRILSFKPGHDGAIAFINKSSLIFSLEGEKNSFTRYEKITPDTFLNAMTYLKEIPDVIAISGWVRGFHSADFPSDAGYFGFDDSSILAGKRSFLDETIDYFSSTHERSHILCSYGLSPFEQGKPCYALNWEGNIGSFYEIDEKVNIKRIGKVLEDPGNKYSFLFTIANQNAPIHKGYFIFSNAGKLMALTSFGEQVPINNHEYEIIEYLLNKKSILLSTDKRELTWSKYYNIGVESQEFKNLAKKFSDKIFSLFYEFAKNNLSKGFPLLISGGCGLNCDWNTKWKNSGLFSDVFVPPCCNDSGSAIGTAIDAQLHYSHNAKISWSVYCGENFIYDIDIMTLTNEFEIYPVDYNHIASFLSKDKIIAWVQGKYEIGPRALGNRSILASPLKKENRDRLNKIKKREHYRPIAPICLEQEVSDYYEWKGPSPYMLYFQKVKSDFLPAITHIDKTARIQTVNESENYNISSLLQEFKKITGYSVLCNTSLNFKGKGFINTLSDLVHFCRLHDLDGFVAIDNFFIKRSKS